VPVLPYGGPPGQHAHTHLSGCVVAPQQQLLLPSLLLLAAGSGTGAGLGWWQP
jgi:hypothetical protein